MLLGFCFSCLISLTFSFWYCAVATVHTTNTELSTWPVWIKLTSHDCRGRKFRNSTCLVFLAVLSIVSKYGCELSFVLRRPMFPICTVQSQICWGLLKTVLTCRQFSSHHRHRQDKTVLFCSCRRCKLGISWILITRLTFTFCIVTTNNTIYNILSQSTQQQGHTNESQRQYIT